MTHEDWPPNSAESPGDMRERARQIRAIASTVGQQQHVLSHFLEYADELELRANALEESERFDDTGD